MQIDSNGSKKKCNDKRFDRRFRTEERFSFVFELKTFIRTNVAIIVFIVTDPPSFMNVHSSNVT